MAPAQCMSAANYLSTTHESWRGGLLVVFGRRVSVGGRVLVAVDGDVFIFVAHRLRLHELRNLVGGGILRRIHFIEVVHASGEFGGDGSLRPAFLLLEAGLATFLAFRRGRGT